MTIDKTTLAVLVTVAFSIIGVLGDYFLKLASLRNRPLGSGWFYLGFALYASTAFGWVGNGSLSVDAGFAQQV